MRLAWFTPWSPQVSGIAGRSAEVTALLAGRGWGIDICVDERRVPNVARASDDAVTPGERRVQSAHDFVWRHVRGQYDLVVYQIGNSRHHDFIWPYLFRWPGLVVLHDARLHHARARRLLRPDGVEAYREEFHFNHETVAIAAAELAIHGFDGRYYAQWPMTRAIVEAARAVAAHTVGGAADLQEAHPGRAISYLPLGEGRLDPISEADRIAVRRAHGATDQAVVFGLFGGLAAEKRVAETLRAFAVIARDHQAARLWLAGHEDPSLGLTAVVRDLGLEDVVTRLGVLDDEGFDKALAAVDVSVNLRWPSAVETSGPWLRALAAGRPSIVMELPHQTHLPAYDPRDWRPRNAVDPREPVTAAVDVLDEHHSLVLAMERLAHDIDFRARLGRAARHYWEAEHTPAIMADRYDAVLREAMTRPVPEPQLPEALRPDLWQMTRRLVTPFGIERCELP